MCTLGQLHHPGAQPGHGVMEQEGAERVGGEPGQDGEEPHRHASGPLGAAPGGHGSEVRGSEVRVNGKLSAFIQRFSNQWPLEVLYNTASHSSIHQEQSG